MRACWFTHSPVGFNPPVFDGAMPANPSAAKPANGFLVNPLICCTFVFISMVADERKKENKLKKEKKSKRKSNVSRLQIDR